MANAYFAEFNKTDADTMKEFRSYCRARPVVLAAHGANDVSYITITANAAAHLMTDGGGFYAYRTEAGTVVIDSQAHT